MQVQFREITRDRIPMRAGFGRQGRKKRRKEEKDQRRANGGPFCLYTYLSFFWFPTPHDRRKKERRTVRKGGSERDENVTLSGGRQVIQKSPRQQGLTDIAIFCMHFLSRSHLRSTPCLVG
mmetsp:Transcript_8600/g.16898  ORF Transcript_8600/g.16898 Transcript_8600/m.16898 type:complete len:121 (-) Transcript_8600:44-406(-)